MDLSHSANIAKGKNYPLRRKSLEESKVQELIECQIILKNRGMD